jgi:hypothetical protein
MQRLKYSAFLLTIALFVFPLNHVESIARTSDRIANRRNNNVQQNRAANF